MLFTLDQSIVELFISGSPQPHDFEYLNTFARGIADGNHRLTGPSRRGLRQIAGLEQLERKTRGVLERAAEQYSEDAALVHQLCVYGNVVAGRQAGISSAVSGTQRVITFPLNWFDNCVKVQKTVLLGENLIDADVYVLVGQAGACFARFKHFEVRAAPTLGGGSTTHLVLDRQHNDGRLCLCIVDGDRLCPGGAIGGTAESVQVFKDALKYPRIAVTETESRDLENLLPDSFYNYAFGNQEQTGRMRILASAGETATRIYFDIEKGLSLGGVFEILSGSLERKFWDAKVPMLTKLFGIEVPCLP